LVLRYFYKKKLHKDTINISHTQARGQLFVILGERFDNLSSCLTICCVFFDNFTHVGNLYPICFCSQKSEQVYMG